MGKFSEMQASLASALENSAAGNVSDLGDFTQYADDNVEDGWRPARDVLHLDAPEEEFCGYDPCRHHIDFHDYGLGPVVPCTLCPDDTCARPRSES